MNLHDKIILQSAKSLLSRKQLKTLKREGKRSQALGEAFDASLDLLEAFDKKDITLSEIKVLIEKKDKASAKLKKMGFDWSL